MGVRSSASVGSVLNYDVHKENPQKVGSII